MTSRTKLTNKLYIVR